MRFLTILLPILSLISVDLEGALNKIKVYSKLNKKPIDLELSKIALQDLIDNKTKQAITPELIMQTVAEHFNIQTSDIISKKKKS